MRIGRRIAGVGDPLFEVSDTETFFLGGLPFCLAAGAVGWIRWKRFAHCANSVLPGRSGVLAARRRMFARLKLLLETKELPQFTTSEPGGAIDQWEFRTATREDFPEW